MVDIWVTIVSLLLYLLIRTEYLGRTRIYMSYFVFFTFYLLSLGQLVDIWITIVSLPFWLLTRIEYFGRIRLYMSHTAFFSL